MSWTFILSPPRFKDRTLMKCAIDMAENKCACTTANEPKDKCACAATSEPKTKCACTTDTSENKSISGKPAADVTDIKCANEFAEICPCPSTTCHRKGRCCVCVNFHRYEETNKLPFCFRGRFTLREQ